MKILNFLMSQDTTNKNILTTPLIKRQNGQKTKTKDSQRTQTANNLMQTRRSVSVKTVNEIRFPRRHEIKGAHVMEKAPLHLFGESKLVQINF